MPILRPNGEPGEPVAKMAAVDTVHTYFGYRGERLGHVVRGPKNHSGNKLVRQVAWCRNVHLSDGSIREGWTYVSFPEPRAVYNAHLVSDAREDGRPTRYLIVEGEKCADRGAALPGWTVVGWIGGSHAWHKTDWSLIAEGVDVALWPDADTSGVGSKTMLDLAQHLAALGCSTLRWIEPPAGAPNKWDLADAVDKDDWSAERLAAFVDAALPWRPASTAEPASLSMAPDSEGGRLPPGMPPCPPPRDKILSEAEKVSLRQFGVRRRSFLNVMKAPAPQLNFALPGMLRGTVGLLVGAGASGKSWAMLQTLISMAAGIDIWSLWSDISDKILSLPAPPGRCLYLAAEDPQEIVDWRIHHLANNALERLRDANLDVNKFLDLIDANLMAYSLYGAGPENAFAIAPSRTETAIQRGPLYENVVQSGFGALITGIDTLARVSTSLEEREGKDMGQVIELAESLTVDTGRANVLFAHHVTKASVTNGQAEEQQAVSGSRKLSDHARWQANMGTMDANTAKVREIDDGDRRKWVKIVGAKMNYAENEGSRWWRRGEHGILVGGFSPPEAPKASNSVGYTSTGSTAGPRASSVRLERMRREAADD
ncbi:AAA family ATPase [Paeniroseomonas aquatica]|uniref:AAA family ATPase n=1 Tax=Paeniroseomonas aquatica TaxID=373043 RepID=A0ABT8A3M4_9PROT|nr:AAA family ATPase [Paeniroseomonas aquatica]MDN3564324.1 AAA family ATPase [Paeniroseomonas aquatica]